MKESPSALAAIKHRILRFSARRGYAVLAIFLLALGLRVAVFPIQPIPAPGVHDEFSYLLMADTFAHGRLTNPMHPMWAHFETFHVNQVPTYCSKFFPAQGFFLAIGQVVFKHPFWGVWLSTGLMCGAICWALQAWVPASWAFLAGILAIIRFGVFNYWADTYWGGSVTALGGALVLGALPRIERYHRVRDAVLMGIGLSILADSRPYEGLFYSVPFLGALGLFIFRSGSRRGFVIRRLALPLTTVMVMNFAFLFYYFWRTTGSALHTPYGVYSARYDSEPLMLWGKPRPSLSYSNPQMRSFYSGWVIDQYRVARSQPFLTIVVRAIKVWLFFIGPALTVPLLVALFLVPYGTKFGDLSKKLRFLLLPTFITFCCSLFPVFFNLHYLAAMTGAVYALVIFAMRRVWVWHFRDDRRGKYIVRAAVLGVFATLVLRVSLTEGRPVEDFTGSYPLREQTLRSKVLQSLEKKDAFPKLVFVHYDFGHNPHTEWVYNEADIDHSAVIWAREVSPREDELLIEYFKGRKALLLDADAHPPKLMPYSLQNWPEQLQVSAKETGN